jgi:O-antigen/teichoic acid export membrane protein
MQGYQGILMTADHSSHKQILKATSIVGGAQVISIFIRIIRTKIIAVLLGTTGVGIAGLYQSTLEIVQSATGFGLGFSAVRDVAEAAGTGNQQRIGRTITILRRWVWLTGLLGVALLILFRKEFSYYAFQSEDHTLDFMILAVVPLFTAISSGQRAILQGVRKISDMARAGILGSIAGLCITVPLYWLMGIRGIVPALILSAFVELGLSWYFAKKVTIQRGQVNWRETLTGGAGMIRLGFFTVIAGLATTGTMYLVRIFISGKMGLDGVGQFQAAWSLSATYVGLILGAMAADYYPRLSAVNQDKVQVCKLVNEQTEITLLLAGPLIVGMICFMDVVVWLFYSEKFGQSINILLWQSLGNLLKVISWPMGLVLLAKSRGGYFVFTELLWNTLFLITIWLLWDYSTIESAGIAFLISYLILTGVIYASCKRICEFTWSRKNIQFILTYTSLSLLAFVNTKYHRLPYWQIYGIGLLVASMFYSYREMKQIINIGQAINKLLIKIGLHKVQ